MYALIVFKAVCKGESWICLTSYWSRYVKSSHDSEFDDLLGFLSVLAFYVWRLFCFIYTNLKFFNLPGEPNIFVMLWPDLSLSAVLPSCLFYLLSYPKTGFLSVSVPDKIFLSKIYFQLFCTLYFGFVSCKQHRKEFFFKSCLKSFRCSI